MNVRSLAALPLALLLAAAAQAKTPPAKAAPQKTPPGRLAGAHFSCTTIGDALGGLDVTAAGDSVTVKESAMSGETSTSKADAGGQVMALAQGKGATFIFKSKKSNEFGGAVSDASLLVIGAKGEDGKRQGWMARGGTVFVLVCK